MSLTRKNLKELWSNVKLFSLGALLGLLVTAFIFPATQKIIPYEDVVITKASFTSDRVFTTEMSFEKTGCVFDGVSTWADFSGELTELPVVEVEPDKNLKRGYHDVLVKTEFPEWFDKENDQASLIIMTDHLCADHEFDGFTVISKALPGEASVKPVEIHRVTKVLARIEIN